MTGFKITTKDSVEIKFNLYWDTAPITSNAFVQILPFSRVFYHARISGQEIWIDNVPSLDIIQENASVFTEPAEVVVGPQKPARTKTANCLVYTMVAVKDWTLVTYLEKLMKLICKN